MVLYVDSLVKSHGELCFFTFIPHSHPLFLSWPLHYLAFFPVICFFFGRVARRPLATTVDGGVLSRLLTPTQASLARSKSAAALSAEGTDAPGNLRLGDPDREESWPGTDLVTLSFHQ